MSVYFLGKGAGDIYIKAECTFVSETYSIEDCTYYEANQTSATLNINLPSNFSISWKVHRTNGTSTTNALSQPQLQDSTHNYYIGQFGSLGEWGFIIRNQGSSSNLVRKDGSPNIPNDTDKTILYTYNNGVHTCEVDGNSVTDTNSYAPTKLYSVTVGSKNVMQNLKIKPL